MGSKFKVLSGKDIVKILSSFGFSLHSHKGSHMKLKRLVSDNVETLIIPNHNPVSPGTLKAIFNQALKYIPRSELQEHFFIK